MNRRVASNIIVFAGLFALMLVWVVHNVVTVRQISHPYPLHGDFAAAGGVQANAEVGLLGVPIGTVAGVHRIPGGVRVDMYVKKGRMIPRGSSANIQRKSAIGEPYVNFLPPDGYRGGGAMMGKGEIVPMGRTTIPIEFSELLRSASALVSSIPPDAVQTLLHEAAIGLAGNAQALQQLADSGDTLTAALVRKNAEIDRILTNNTTLIQVVAAHRDSLSTSIHDIDQVAQTLRDGRGHVDALLDTGSQFLGVTADLVGGEKAHLDCTLKDLGVVVNAASDQQKLAELKALLQIGPAAFAGLWDATETTPGPNGQNGGVYTRVGLVANEAQNPPPSFNPPKPYPTTNAVPACASKLAPVPTGVDYTPAAAVPAPSLPATGREAGLGLVAALLLAAAVLRLTARVERGGHG